VTIVAAAGTGLPPSRYPPYGGADAAVGGRAFCGMQIHRAPRARFPESSRGCQG
jgi:hypothetical protein